MVTSSFPELGDRLEDLAKSAFPTLDEVQFARAAAYGRPEPIVEGQVVFDVGDDDADMLLVESGEIEVALGDVHDGPALAAKPRQFVGELNLLTGQSRILSARAVASGVVHRVPPDQFRLLMAQDTELSDLLLRSFIARRQLLVQRAGRNLAIIADEASGSGLALRTFLIRQDMPHRWVEHDTPEGRDEIAAAGLTEADLPAAILPRVTLRNVEPRALSHRLGLTFRRTPKGVADLTIVGAGPAGLAAAVERVLADPRITVRTSTEVTGLAGRHRLEEVTLTTGAEPGLCGCSGLFCFIGATPATGWLTDVALDERGFVPTDVQLGDRWTGVGRGPLPFESSVPGVFAAGDVRWSSMKRVAAAVGEGASAVRSVHQALAAGRS
uniref:FAD-dependent oxidoreductase n=1 Tax=Paractinoplanes polyasparticus TaxID=2856853 RepID=UPI0027E21132|nr:FAD-dependent oxidoreductase [Actinoplanes polyasparticus]